MISLYAIPNGAASAREWVVWASEIVGGLIVVGVAIRKSIQFMARQTREGITDVLRPELDRINAKVDSLSSDLANHILANPGLPESLQKHPAKGPPRPRYGA